MQLTTKDFKKGQTAYIRLVNNAARYIPEGQIPLKEVTIESVGRKYVHANNIKYGNVKRYIEKNKNIKRKGKMINNKKEEILKAYDIFNDDDISTECLLQLVADITESSYSDVVDVLNDYSQKSEKRK